MAAAIYLKGFTPSVCWFGLLLFVLLEKRREVTAWVTDFFEWRLWVQLLWGYDILFVCLFVFHLFFIYFYFWSCRKKRRWCFPRWYVQQHALITPPISLCLSFHIQHVLHQITVNIHSHPIHRFLFAQWWMLACLRNIREPQSAFLSFLSNQTTKTCPPPPHTHTHTHRHTHTHAHTWCSDLSVW